MSTQGIKASKLLPAKPDDIKASHIGTIDGKTAHDPFNCWLTGAVLVSENRIALCDLTNECVKVVDTAEKKVTSRIKTKRKPWAIGKLVSGSNIGLYVTIPNQQIIQCFKVLSNGGIQTNQNGNIKTDGECHGIVGYHSFLIVSFTTGNGRVDMIDPTGGVVRTFPTEHKGARLFSTPDSLCLNVSLTVLYVTDSKNNSVTGIGVEGNVVGTYKDDGFKEVRGVTTDLNNNIYLCSLLGDQIQMLSPELKKVKVILKNADGILRPCSMLYRPSDHTLVLGSKGKLKMYQLK